MLQGCVLHAKRPEPEIQIYAQHLLQAKKKKKKKPSKILVIEVDQMTCRFNLCYDEFRKKLIKM